MSAEALEAPVGRSTIALWARATKQENLAFFQRLIANDIRFSLRDGMSKSKKRVTARKEPVLAVIGITQMDAKYVLNIMPLPV